MQEEDQRCLLDVSTGSHYNFDQRNFCKQQLEARMYKVEERDEEMSRDSELGLFLRKCG